MPDITMAQIMDKLGERLPPEEADVLLAYALDKLDLPVKELYSPPEVMAIGTTIADSQRETLRDCELPEVRELEKHLGEFIDGLKYDLLGQR